jgi:AcrR family transcriptional regulator
VAKEVGVSVGTVYAYFEDKHDLLMAVVDRYMVTFDAERDEAMGTLRTSKDSLRDTLRHLIDRLVAVHQESKAFNLELKTLYYTDPAITALMDAQDGKIRSAITDFLRENQRKYRIDDPVASAFIIDRIIQTTVEKIVFDPGDIDRESLVSAAVTYGHSVAHDRIGTKGKYSTNTDRGPRTNAHSTVGIFEEVPIRSPSVYVEPARSSVGRHATLKVYAEDRKNT